MNYEVVNFCEIDKYASKSYCAIHNIDDAKNLGDIVSVDENTLPQFDMICGGSPCNDFSIAGKQRGSKWECRDCGFIYNPIIVDYRNRSVCPHCGSRNLDKTYSSLLIEWLRIVRSNMPKWCMYENVKNLMGKNFVDTFGMFIKELQDYGYNTYYRLLNANDYGVAQSRERIYVVCIRRDIDNGKFQFPPGTNNVVTLRDILEPEIEYDDDKHIIRRLTPLECWRVMGFDDDDYYKAVDAGISESQLFKQAGNSIAVNVVYYIYSQLYDAMPYLFDNLKIGSFFSGIGAFEKGLARLYERVEKGSV